MFEDAKEIIRGRKAKVRHKMDTRKKDKKTSNDLQNTTLMIDQHEPHTND